MHSLEITAYYAIFLASLFYSLFRFWQTTQEYINYVDATDFVKDCSLFLPCHLRKDVTDLEWQVTKQYYLQSKIVYLFLHSVGFYIVRRISPKYISTFVVLYSICALGYLISPSSLFYIFINILIIILLSHGHFQLRKYFSYVLFLLSIIVIHRFDLEKDREQNLLIQVCLSWLNARGLSCILDSEPSGLWQLRNDSFTKLAYLLYFPPFFFGPIYHYSDFAKMVNRLQQNDCNLDPIDMWLNSLNLLRYLFWAWFLEFVLHFFYSSSFQYYVYLTETFDSWSLFGFAFGLTILFYLKYLVIYGVARAMAQLDGLNEVIAKPPECIAHMHRTSYLWRRFDQGLYSFLARYFYKPLTGSGHSEPWRRIAAGLISFFIVAIWHGYYDAIIVWVVLNILLFASEIMVSMYLPRWLRHPKFGLSESNQLRAEAVIDAPFLVLAYLSNIFFLSNYESGMVLINRIFLNGLIPLLPILFIFYSGCQVCKHINRRISKANFLRSNNI